MLHTDRDALLCDLAEQYHLFSLRDAPLETVAALACGLRPTARIFQAMGIDRLPEDKTLQLMAVDALQLLVWLHSRDAQKGRNRPRSLLAQALERRQEPNVMAFDSPEEFEAARAEICGRAGTVASDARRCGMTGGVENGITGFSPAPSASLRLVTPSEREVCGRPMTAPTESGRAAPSASLRSAPPSEREECGRPMTAPTETGDGGGDG